MTAEVCGLLKTRDEAFRSGDKAALKTARANLSCGIKNAKRSHAQKINNHFTDSRDTRSLWQAIQTITDYKPPPQACDDDTSLPDALNHFYSRFEMQNNTPAQKLPTPPNDQALCLSAADVRKTLSRINPRRSWQHTWPCTERLCCTADGCPNRYLQNLAEPGSRPHMSQIHNNHTGTKEITCVLSKRLPSHSTDSNPLLTHDCTAKFSSNHIIKFADDKKVVGLISNNDETHYREEVAQLAEWCGTNNVGKTKEVLLDFRRNSVDHPPLTIDSQTVERVSSTKFLGVHITEDLTWTTNTMSLSKKAQQRLHFLRRLKRASLPPPILTTFYRGTIESVLTSCITVWYGNCSAADRKTLQRTVNTAAKIIGAPLPSILDIFLARCSSKTSSIVKDPHPPLPQSLPAPTIRKTVPEHQSPLRQTAQQLFPPGCESPEPKSHRPPSETQCKPLPPEPWTPPPLQTPPNLTTPKKKLCETFSVQFKCATHRWVGLYKPPVVTHSPLCTRHFSHTAVCTQSHKRLSNICMFTCSCTTNHLVLFPSQLLDSQCFSLHMYSIYVKQSYSLYFLSFIFSCIG